MFKNSQACPVGCKYCSVTQTAYRKEQWSRGRTISINKTVTILNKDYADWLEPEYFTSDILCFEASSDPFWLKRFYDFEKFCQYYAPVARLITFVTKMPITKKHLAVLNKVKTPVAIVISVTGLDDFGIEKTTRQVLYDNIKKCQDLGIPVIPLIHPYIHGLADVNGILKELKSLGMKYYQIKGFRFDKSMTWLPDNVYGFYQYKEFMEYMPKIDIQDDGMTKIELRDFYKMHQLPPKIDRQTAFEYVSEVVKNAIITSSAEKKEVVEYAIRRRYE